MRMARYTLSGTSADFDFLLIGIMCQENMYYLVSAVNDVLGTDLSLSDNVPYNLKDGKLFNFSLFHFLSEELALEFFLVPNSSNLEQEPVANQEEADLFSEFNVEESVKLIKELPKTDYFIIVKGEDLHLQQFSIIEKLKKAKKILQVQIIEPKELPSRMNLVF